MVLTTATDVNQIVLDQLQAQFPSHIEQKIVQGTKSKTSRALLKEKMTIAINAGGKPVLTIPKISKIPKLAGAVPAGYIDEIKKIFGEEVSKEYSKYAEYFTGLVKKDNQDIILENLSAVFNNPGDKDSWRFFMDDLEEFANWSEVDMNKFVNLKELMNKIGKKLDGEISNLTEVSASQDEIIAKIKKNIENGKIQLQKLEKLEEELRGQKEELRGQKEELRGQKEELRLKRKKLREEIEKIKQQIKDRGGDIELLEGKLS